MNQATFSSPWDGKLVLSTLLLSIIIGGGCALTAYTALSTPMPRIAKVCLLLAALVPAAAIVGAAAYAPLKMSISSAGIEVHRLIGPVVIPFERISRVDLLEAERLRGSIREFGVSGLFGHFGRFRSKDIGPYTLYATSSGGYVLVEADKPIVLTPERPEEFVASVRSRMHAPGR